MKNRKLFFILVFFLITFAMSCKSTKSLVDVGCEENGNITACLDKNYAGNNNIRQTLNIWLPCKIHHCDKKFPLIVHIHGGGFTTGEKMEKPNIDFLEAGFAFSSINYRLIPESKFPDYLHDAKAAIRWLRSNNRDLRIDSSRIGIYGESAGGALTSYMAFTNGINKVEINGNIIDIEGNIGNNKNESSEISAAINYYGHADSKMFCDLKKGLDPNCEDTSNFCHSCTSPISYIGKGRSVRYMIIHGTDDKLVPYIHGDMLSKKFTEIYPNNNPELTFITVKNGGHGWWDKKTFNHISNSTKNFFLRNLDNNREFKKEKSRIIVSEKLNYDKEITNIEKQKNDK